MDKIVNTTIAACNPLDKRTNSVVSRTDLCKLNFNLSSIIGESHYCAATTSSSLGFGFSKRAQGSTTSTAPAQNGTVTAEGVAVAQAIYDGLHNSDNEHAYLSWQIASNFGDAATTYKNNTGSWELSIPSTGGAYVTNAAHCGTNSLQPGPYPEDNMEIMIDWIENGVKPTALNATVSSGTYAGETQMLCQWPTRPLWQSNSTTFDCVNEEASIDSWTYTFDAFKIPVY
ncbi:hypothetical protein EAF00_000908 [Botryotinia globosa]|nr:hypothetical protein EAF00_000908 [Botryotinia globosa]